IVQEGMNRFRGVPLERFREIASENQRSGKYGRVIFTGGEVTLEKSLPEFLRCARDSGGFRHIRLQTNGRKLSDPAFARVLVDDGVDELFLSLHGPDAATQDAIAQRPGGFAETMAGLENLRGLPVRLITNTVVHPANLPGLAAIVDAVQPFSPARMEFWN